MIFYDVHNINFDDRSLNILWSRHIQSLILKTVDSVHDQSNNNDSNLKIKNFYINARINCMMKNATLKFTPPHMN